MAKKKKDHDEKQKDDALVKTTDERHPADPPSTSRSLPASSSSACAASSSACAADVSATPAAASGESNPADDEKAKTLAAMHALDVDDGDMEEFKQIWSYFKKNKKGANTETKAGFIGDDQIAENVQRARSEAQQQAQQAASQRPGPPLASSTARTTALSASPTRTPATTAASAAAASQGQPAGLDFGDDSDVEEVPPTLPPDPTIGTAPERRSRRVLNNEAYPGADVPDLPMEEVISKVQVGDFLNRQCPACGKKLDDFYGRMQHAQNKARKDKTSWEACGLLERVYYSSNNNQFYYDKIEAWQGRMSRKITKMLNKANEERTRPPRKAQEIRAQYPQEAWNEFLQKRRDED